MAKTKKSVGTTIVPFFSSRTVSDRHSAAQHQRFRKTLRGFTAFIERQRIDVPASEEEAFFQAVISAIVDNHGVSCVLHALAGDTFDRAERQVEIGINTEEDQFELSSVLALAHRINALACEIDADNAKRDME